MFDFFGNLSKKLLSKKHSKKRRRKNPKNLADFQTSFNYYKTKIRKSPTTNTYRANWVVPHEHEEQHGVAILQRQARLREKLVAGKKDEEKSSPPMYDASIIEAEIQQLNKEWLLHHKRLREMENDRRHCPSDKWVDITRFNWDESGRPWKWRTDQVDCAQYGGCCGHSCGCCQKALHRFLMPMVSDRKREWTVYGHCTAECACCIKRRGCYIPDKRLPQSSVLEPK